MTSEVVEAGDGLPLTIPALLRERAATFGDAALLVCDDEVLTYAEASARSAALAHRLLALGAGPGSHIGLLHPNGPAFVVGWLAAARIGAVTVPLSTFSTAAELRGLLQGAAIDVLLSVTRYRNHDEPAKLAEALDAPSPLPVDGGDPIWSAAAPALRHVLFDVDGIDGDETVLRALEDAVRPADRMVIVHTSGSTSEPKGVIHQHGPLIRHLDNLNELRRYTPDEVLFSNSPFFWIGGFAYALLGTLVAGARLVCSNAAEAAGVLDTIERERPTMVNGFAQSVAHLPDDPSFAARDLSSIRRGNLWPIMPAAVRPDDPELRHGMLGMTEAGSVCLVDPDESDQPEHRRGSFGRPAPGFEARVVDPDDGHRCGPHEVGVLQLRGPFLMEGYLGRERHETFDPDGWYDTGDLVLVDDDGLFYFKGRRGDMIKTGGANVSPREVERAILDAAGLVSHVVGIDDAKKGQLVAAAVVVPADRSVDLDGLRAELGKHLSVYKVPARLRAFGEGEVPMMSSGKLDLRALKVLLSEMAAEVAAEVVADG